MEIVFVILALAAAAWGLVFAQRSSLIAGCTAFVILGYVLTRDFWEIHLGPLPLTVGRVLLSGLVLLCAWRIYRGRLKLRPLTGADVLGILSVGYLALRWLVTPAPETVATSVSPSWRLIASFLMPLTLVGIVRNAEVDPKHWKILLGGLVGLGVYLAATGLAEVTEQWWAVFPRFISDPTLGTHFGRARGPALMSASLGLYLTVTFWAAWFLWRHVSRPMQLVLIAAMLLMCAGLYFTYTRSCWLGLAAGLAIIPILHFPRSWRSTLAVGVALSICLGGVVLGGKLVNMGRDDTDDSAGHSVYQRASFAIVSWNMFRDAPLFGCGFGRFYDKKMPYLSDRSHQIELESIRKLDHHNTFLSILTETGLVGFTLFIALIVGWFRCAWRLFRCANADDWVRAHGLFTLAVLIGYCTNALFHDLTLSPSDEWIVALTCGMSTGLQVFISRPSLQSQTVISAPQSSGPLSLET